MCFNTLLENFNVLSYFEEWKTEHVSIIWTIGSKSLSSKVLLQMTTILVWIWVKSSQLMQLACHCFLKLCDNNQLRAKNCSVNFASLLLQCSLLKSGERITSSVTFIFCQIGQTKYPFSIAHKNTGFYRKCFFENKPQLPFEDFLSSIYQNLKFLLKLLQDGPFHM